MPLSYDAIRRALSGRALPAALLDVVAFEHNLQRHGRAAERAGLSLRFATKSIRVRGLIERALALPCAKGLLCYSAPEAAWLADSGFDDLFVAYPTLRDADLQALCKRVASGKTIYVAIDSVCGATAVARAADKVGASLPVAVCADMSLRALGGTIHVGVRRSPLAEPEQVLALAEAARVRGLSVVGLLGYEAQVAGLGDASPHDALWQRSAKRLLRSVSMRELSARRSRMVLELRSAGFELSFVNGGGTGSLDLSNKESGLTEVSAGSGLYKPLLFDHYSSPFVMGLAPACFFALQAVRRPAPGVVTCFGGGYVASGAYGKDKLPAPWLPRGLSLLTMEGAGEVQTPVSGDDADKLVLGEPVVFRHAKAGELMERFAEVLLLAQDGSVNELSTYRGEGQHFG